MDPGLISPSAGAIFVCFFLTEFIAEPDDTRRGAAEMRPLSAADACDPNANTGGVAEKAFWGFFKRHIFAVITGVRLSGEVNADKPASLWAAALCA